MLALYLALVTIFWTALFFNEEAKDEVLLRILFGGLAILGAFLFLREMGYVVKL